jgi:hypothetical protein
MHVSAELNPSTVLGVIELTHDREFHLSARRHGSDAEGVFSLLRDQAKTARTNRSILD